MHDNENRNPAKLDAFVLYHKKTLWQVKRTDFLTTNRQNKRVMASFKRLTVQGGDAIIKKINAEGNYEFFI